MKPRIALFGLPLNLSIRLYVIQQDEAQNTLVFSLDNTQPDHILDYVTQDIEIGCDLRLSIMCSGICVYTYDFPFNGADISHVPNLQKETNTREQDVSADWNIDYWRSWNASEQHEKGLAQEKAAILDKTIIVEPMWISYYADSKIDYFEKFHKLWLGLNAFARHSTGESGDKKRILALVENQKLRDAFHGMLNSDDSEISAEKHRALQEASGLNMTSDIVRDEVSAKVSWIDFLETAKMSEWVFSDISKELDGLAFLTSTTEDGIFRDVFRAYHTYSSSEQGRVHPFNMADAFSAPKAPQSIGRFGRLIFHNPFESSASGSLFSVEDFLGTEYANGPYLGQISDLKAWEEIDPLFFRYLHVLYKFRCSYFHGDLPLNKQNNELARTAYQSLHELFPAVF